MSNTNQQDKLNIKEFLAAEDELRTLKETYGIVDADKKGLVDRLLGLFYNKTDVTVKRKTYLWLMLFTGVFGGHRFYAKQYLAGILYLATCWCGVSLAMTIIDVLVVLPMEVDEVGMITFKSR
ncbi:MAG: TM2 domain-containing protein [Pseudobutyrivibrio sp.]|nr:TM2 domain-containing protein [Pseudobutyrivibrio sp.]